MRPYPLFLRSKQSWARLLASTAPGASRRFADDAASDAVHGIATPITLQLWNQRLKRDNDLQTEALQAEPVHKFPFRTAVTYPFTTDHVLHEKVPSAVVAA